jgi:hypothetical protein
MPKLNTTLKFLCIKVANELTDSHYSIRSSCISLLASLAPIIIHVKSMRGQAKFTGQDYLDETQIQTIIRDFGKDSDPRVRSVRYLRYFNVIVSNFFLFVTFHFFQNRMLSKRFFSFIIVVINLIYHCIIYVLPA